MDVTTSIFSVCESCIKFMLTMVFSVILFHKNRTNSQLVASPTVINKSGDVRAHIIRNHILAANKTTMA